jgi:hypothetical protein
MAKHTQGPWHAEYFPSAFGWDVTHGPADDASQRFSVLDDPTEENSKLMAAAPEMLEAIEEFFECWMAGKFLYEGADVMAKLRKSSAKARGKE